MKRINLSAAISACLVASFATPVLAQTERDLDSHEHGAASMNVAIDGSTVFIELESPWNNLVGFEHEPSTEEQHELVDNALAKLNEAKSLFGFNGTECSLLVASIENGLGEDDHDDHDDHDDEHASKDDHDDDHDDHDDEHADKDDHEDHDDEHADHDDHGDEGEVHSSVAAFYSFECGDSKKLESIDVKILSVWSGFEELDVQLIGPSGQGAAELTADATQIDLTGIR